MEVDEQPASGLRKALVHGEESTQLGGRRIDKSAPCSELMDVDQSRTSRAVDDSQLLGGSDFVPAERVDDRAAATGVPLPEIAAKGRADENGLGKRRRGRPPRGQQKPTLIPRTSISSDGEDVCFICFDGGSLVLCDRRGCPKAYHPACIKRDEAFFQSTAKWNCGWHICSSCRKASHYMCYTCTYSLCKGCIKDADYQCVRGSKGLCGTCMRTIMLLEKSSPGSGDNLVQVDFDDKSSWEYLFKIYWVYLKQKLSLTLDDLIRAKNPWNGGVTVDQNGEAIGYCRDANNGNNRLIDSAGGGAIAANSKMKTLKRQLNLPSNDKMMSSIEGNSWATKELLEFVAHSRNGDVSALSQFDVQSLVLEYIRSNNLRDPQQRSHIICDRMLMNLFGKQRVGHFEMLKLLEYHFLSEESSLAVERNSQVLDVEKGNDSYQLINDGDKKRKTRKKDTDLKKRQVNPDEYAAIDVHNINLIYLSRNLIESMMGDDAEKFRDKVVGSFVRIRVSSRDQKPDVYRLVQVVGTCKSSEPYVIGEKTADVMLDVLNLDKKEAVSIRDISNQDFSEDECRHLHESVKCGILKRFIVGEIQKKAMAIQALKVNDRLESEILRLNHLRDRASEKGHKKELRECVEKLQLLNSPEERQRRLVEMPEIHVDPTLDPSFKSDDHTKESNKSKQGGFERASKISSKRKCRGRDLSIHLRSRIENRSANHLNNPTSLEIGNGSNPVSNDADMDKMWHYQDPAGKIQGPFSMSLLQKWSSSGHFPPHLRVWRMTEMPGDSILLTDAMKGQYGKNSVKIFEDFGLRRCSDNGDNQPNDEWSRNRHSNESGSPADCSLPGDGVNSSELRQSGFVQRAAKEERGHGCEKRSDSDGCSGQSSGQNWRPLPANDTRDSRSCGIALSISIEPQNSNFDFPDLPSPTPAKILVQDSVLGDESHWPVIISPDEFNSLGDESLSDLLAEVEAMESLSELASSKSPILEMGRGDALSSTGDGQVRSQSTITVDLQMKVAGCLSTIVEVDINKKYDNVSTMETAENSWRIGSEATDASWGSGDIEWGGIKRGNSNSGLEILQESIREMGSMNSGSAAAYNGTNWYGQLKYGIDRLSSPRDNGRSRSFSDKQPEFGCGNKIVQSRPPPSGQSQRVCKFYENGYCKLGASCSYLHH